MSTILRVARGPLLPAFLLASALLGAGAILEAQTPSAVDVPLLSSTSEVRTLQGNHVDTFAFKLDSNQCVDIAIEQDGIDVVAQVLDSEAKPIIEADADSRPHGTEKIEVCESATSTYALKVKARYPKLPAGKYAVALANAHALTDRDRLYLDAEIAGTSAAALRERGKYDEALESARKAMTAAEKANGAEDSSVATYASMVGSLLRAKGDKKGAQILLQRALDIDEKAFGRSNVRTARDIQLLGNLYKAMEEYAKSETMLREALELHQKLLGRDHPRVAGCLSDLAALHNERGELDLSMTEMKEGVQIAEKTLEDSDFTLIILINNLADAYITVEDYDRAEPFAKRALDLIEKKYGPDNPRVTVPLLNMGIIAREKKDYRTSLNLLWRAEDIRVKAYGKNTENAAMLLISIGRVYHAQGDYTKALETFLQALDVLESAVGPYSENTLLSLINIARTYTAAGDIENAALYQRRVDEVLEKDIELNLSIGSEREKLAYIDRLSERTDRTVSFNIQIAPEDPSAADLAALVILQRKGRVLDSLAANFHTVRQHMGAREQSLFDDLNETNTQLATVALKGPGKNSAAEFKKKVAEIEEKRDQLETAIAARSEEFRAWSRPVTLEGVQQSIPSNAALVEFVVYRPFDAKALQRVKDYDDPRYAAYVLHRSGRVQFRDLGPAKQIDSEVRKFRSALREPTRTGVVLIGRKLHDVLVAPLIPLIGESRHLLISPDGDLNLIPFEALVTRRNRFLIEDFFFTYLTSGRDLLRMQGPRNEHGEPVVIAAPRYDEDLGGQSSRMERAKLEAPSRSGSKISARRSVTTTASLSQVYFAPLPGTVEEARAIKRLFPNAKVLQDNRATKAALMQVKSPQILHIATHGFFLTDLAPEPVPADKYSRKPQFTRNASASITDGFTNPLLRSGLALAGANGQKAENRRDGILTALEASNIDLWGTQLVTLSACDTGVGEVRNGEGVYGLRRSFFLAGTESLVMSLWPVSDYVTRQTMTAYYDGLKRGLGRGEALRNAELSVLKQKGRNHPFYWASFIQSGAWTALSSER